MAPPNKAGNCVNGYCEIPGRTFLMGFPENVGEDDEHPQRGVTLSTQRLRRTEVTVDEMTAFYAKREADLSVVLSGCGSLDPKEVVVKGIFGETDAALLERAHKIANEAGCSVDSLKVDRHPKQGIAMYGYCGVQNSRGGDHPVVCVNQEEAAAFCASEGGYLPSEALIESAMRGTSGTEEYGNPIESAAIYENLVKTLKPGEEVGTQSVCGPKNEREGPFGVCDLSGNAWEITSTEYVRDYYRTMPERDPNKPVTPNSELVVFRGGSFDSYRRLARAADRGYDGPGNRDYGVGFRCARSRPQDSE